MTTNNWNAQRYKQFLDLRTQPARDLVSAIPDNFQPKTVVDLGCGPGNSTILLKERWPQAEVIGLDSSPEMLAEAKKLYPDLIFIKDDIAQFAPAAKIDCLFANASLQWLDDHNTLIPRLSGFLNSQGILAIQMPNNFHSPTHQTILHILQSKAAWKPLLKKLRYGILTKPLYHLPKYYDLLTKSELHSLRIWETTYFQEMTNYQEMLDWVKGTALHVVFSLMNHEEQSEFSEAYISAIAKEYPLQENQKILLPFKRIFMVGIKL
jgi:trans-aconitate 2-methyltransferase